MKTIIAGSRGMDNYEFIKSTILESGFEITEVVSGGARGADRLGERYAKEMGIPIKQFIPDWDGLGKKAGHVRNREMGDYADALIVVIIDDSKGSVGMYEYATKKGLKVHAVWLYS